MLELVGDDERDKAKVVLQPGEENAGSKSGQGESNERKGDNERGAYCRL